MAQLTWLDRSGRPLKTIGESAPYATIALSPDDRTIATTFRAPAADASGNIYVIDATTGDSKRVTFERVQDYSPIWSPDAQRLVFVGRRDGVPALTLLKVASLQEEVLLRLASDQTASGFRPSGWSRDGRHIVGAEAWSASRSTDVWTLSVDTREKRAYVETPAHESNADFSPDGKWVAYEVTDPGRAETQIFVRRFPPTDEKHQISTAGGVQPLWAPDGKEIFFLTASGEPALMSAEVVPSEVFQSRRPRRLFPVHTVPSSGLTRHYAVSRDGTRFLVAVRQQTAPVPLTVVVNWLSQTK
jgi:Tol biopolymer transport system component